MAAKEVGNIERPTDSVHQRNSLRWNKYLKRDVRRKNRVIGIGNESSWKAS